MQENAKEMLSGKKLEQCSDEELARLSAISPEAEASLLSRYQKLIWFYAGRFAKNPADAEDLAQEGMMALLHAMPLFQEEKQTKFAAFAKICVLNRMRSFVRRQNRTVPLDVQEAETLEEDLADPETPETIFLEKENYNHCCMQVMAVLSKREWEILRNVMTGLTYQQTARTLGISVKSVDNAMQRVRRKMRTEESIGSFPQ